MRAMVLYEPGRAQDRPLHLTTVHDPIPAADEILVDVTACGVCRTDLHIVEGDIPLPRLPIVPGHEVVGRVAEIGVDVGRFQVGQRVGIAWVHRFCGACAPCVAGRENLCESPTFTGYHRDGGYAERVVAPAAFAHALPQGLGSDAEAAPLLCAGIIGYRALRRSGIRPGERLALYGFGGSAHIALQVARAWGCEVFVVSRSRDALSRARRLGAAWAGHEGEAPPRQVDAAVSFAPAGGLIPAALSALRPGGRLALAGIYVDHVPQLDYDRHLFGERELVSVTANTRQDAREFLAIAARIGVRTDVVSFPLEAANDALAALAGGSLAAQAAVLVMR